MCAYPMASVLSRVWKTCGSIPGFTPSPQLIAIQRHIFGVDNNLFGVSGQVKIPGVLAFGQIFGKLRTGYHGHSQDHYEQLAKTTTRGYADYSPDAALAPAAAAWGLPPGSWKTNAAVSYPRQHRVKPRR
jgi:hypothetical protein